MLHMPVWKTVVSARPTQHPLPKSHAFTTGTGGLIPEQISEPGPQMSVPIFPIQF